MIKKDSAISPIIGVILMLALTLITAAVVSSFAGGMMETKAKLPSVTIDTDYTNSGNFTITHLSGDPIPLSQIKIVITPSQTFGLQASKHSRELNVSKFQNSNSEHWGGNLTMMKVGDRLWIKNSDLSALDEGESNSKFNITNEDNEGKTFFFEMLFDHTSVVKNEVLIKG